VLGTWGLGGGLGAPPIKTGCSVLPRFLRLDQRGVRGRGSYTSGRARADQSGTAEGVPGVVLGSFWEGTPSDGSDRLPDRPRVRELITLGERLRLAQKLAPTAACELDKIASTINEASPMKVGGAFS
jgi:hypothetical protein